MNRLAFVPLCGALLLTSVGVRAKDKPLEVSKDNFVSLHWTRTGGFAGVYESYAVQNHEIVKQSDGSFPPLRGGFGGGGGGNLGPEHYSPPQVAPLSENQWKELLEQLKKAQVPAIGGNYKQEGLSDGFNETLTLTLSGSDNLDQSFTINNYGNKAPASYSAFTRYFGALLANKFSSASATSSPITPFLAPSPSQPAPPRATAPKE